ncbi:MAG: hypothetical protein AAF446_01020 [Pseudomonadota bacterium]
MTKLTESERQKLKASVRRPHHEPSLSKYERIVADTPEARLRYIQFATQAAKLCKSKKPVAFGGDHWKL